VEEPTIEPVSAKAVRAETVKLTSRAERKSKVEPVVSVSTCPSPEKPLAARVEFWNALPTNVPVFAKK
jgi:hypothetical protein